jgi:hypothetical protein
MQFDKDLKPGSSPTIEEVRCELEVLAWKLKLSMAGSRQHCSHGLEKDQRTIFTATHIP